MIPVTKPYLPDIGKYQRHIHAIYERNWLTNNGPMVCELKTRLEEYLGVKHLLPVANGTLALQLAFKALDVSGSVVTTPFTFVATSSALRWEGIRPVFADVDGATGNLSVEQAQDALMNDTTALLPVHVYGNPCDLQGMAELAERKELKLIYDAAHAIGVDVKGKSVLTAGDASTLSFHATKVFHTVEGGAIIFKDQERYERALAMTNFGMNGQGEIVSDGINAKMSEVHAAMGLAMLDELDQILLRRREQFALYRQLLHGYVEFPVWHTDASHNGAYMPVIFDSPDICTRVLERLAAQDIFARRYFAPSLDQLPFYGESVTMPRARSLSARVLTLPLYYQLTDAQIRKICHHVRQGL